MRLLAATIPFENIRGKIDCHTYDARGCFPFFPSTIASNVVLFTSNSSNSF